MAPQAILASVRQIPFEPFQLVLADGAKYEILHPDQCMVMKREVVIGQPARNGDYMEWSLKINCWNVARIERVRSKVESTVAV
jgi:hypothetical protein